MSFVKSIPLKLIFLPWMLFVLFSLEAQTNLDELENQLDSNFGLDKLIILNQITDEYQEINSRKALKYGKQAVALAEKLLPEDTVKPENIQYNLKVDAYNVLGVAHFNKQHYYDAKLNFQSALNYALLTKYPDGIVKAETYLAILDSIGVKSNIFKETFNDIKLSRAIKSGSKDLALSTTIKTAETYKKNGNYAKAISNYEKAINYLTDKGEEEQIAELYRQIAECYDLAGNISKSLEYYKLAIGEKERLGDTTGMQASIDSVSNLHQQIEELVEPKIIYIDTVQKKIELKTLEDYKKMAIESEANEDFEKSLEYYKLYNDLNDKIIEDEKQQELAMLEKSHQIERNLQEIQLLTQDKEIQDLELIQKESEIEQQNVFRKNLSIGIVLLLALAVTLYLLYFNKRRDHNKLNVAHNDLQSTQGQLLKAEKRIKTLLGQQLSPAVASELISESDDKKIERKLVCLMFLDIRGFTTFAESRKPEDIIKYQNDVFGFMIDSVYKYNGIINQFLGDGFMATFGAPVSKGNDSENAFLAANEIVQKVNDKSEKGEIPQTRIGIGLHTGKVVVGNVGTTLRKQYSITGNAVIIAARIEQLNKQYKSQLLISENVQRKLNASINKFKSLGLVELKGREKPIRIFKVL